MPAGKMIIQQMVVEEQADRAVEQVEVVPFQKQADPAQQVKETAVEHVTLLVHIHQVVAAEQVPADHQDQDLSTVQAAQVLPVVSLGQV